ncbi:MAG: hypothetical protein IJD65_05260 [Mailhella sp.]|nr:hypothetical protein [Mailhella sp.]
MDNDIEKKYEELFRQQAATSPVFTYAAKQQMAEMMEAALRGRTNIEAELSTARAVGPKSGFIAEEWHAESFNLDAILKGKQTRAVTDRYSNEWATLGKGRNDTPADIVVTKNEETLLQAQIKYNQTPENAVTGGNSFSQMKNGRPKYQNSDIFVAPSDHVHPKDGSVSIAEHAQAKADAVAKNGGQEAEVELYQQIRRKIRSKVEADGVSSQELTKGESMEMAENDLRKLDKMESSYKTKSTLQQASKAAVGAAAMAAVVSGTVNTVRYVQMAREGKISAEDAAIKIMAETASAAADSAVKAGAVVTAQSMLVRAGTEKVVIGTLAQQGMRSLARTNVVTVGVVCAIDAIKDLVSLGMGKMTKEQFYERQGKNILNTGAGVTGGTLGALAGEAAAAGMGLTVSVGGLALLPFIGCMAGGLIAGMAMQSAIENGVERPYRELMRNTALRRCAAEELERLSVRVFQSQILFGRMLEEEYMLDNLLHASMKRMDANNNRVRDILSRF